VATNADYALDLALVCLTGGRMARLQRRLVYDGDLATSVSCSNDTRVDSGAFWLFVECAQGADPAELERVVAEELARMAEEKVSAAELKRARAILNASDAFDSETVSDLAEELGEWAVDLDWRLAFDGGAGYERITAEMLRATVARFLSPEGRVTGWCLPREAETVEPVRLSRPKTRSGARKRAAKQ
jgi:zinc protease